MTAEIYVSGLLKLKPNHHQYKRVTQKQFWAGLSLFMEPLLVDARLDHSHGLVNYCLTPESHDKYRKTFRSNQIGYIHYNEYVLHETIIKELISPNNALSIQSTPVEDIKKTLPELLELVGIPQAAKNRVHEKLRKAGRELAGTFRGTPIYYNTPNNPDPTDPNTPPRAA